MTLHPAPKHFKLNEESPVKFQMAFSSDKILEKNRFFFRFIYPRIYIYGIEKMAERD